MTRCQPLAAEPSSSATLPAPPAPPSTAVDEDSEARMKDYLEQIDHYAHFYSPYDSPDYNIIPNPMMSAPVGTSPRLILIRHGRSTWNVQGRTQGWADPPLHDTGHTDARRSALKLLKLRPMVETDVIFCSTQMRARQTTEYVMEVLRTQRRVEYGEDAVDFPLRVKYDNRLRERHYGAFSGHLKSDNVERFGAELLEECRKGAFAKPPYGGEPFVPNGHESLKDVQDRVSPMWNDEFRARLERGEDVVVVAHNNLIRALMTFVDPEVKLDNIYRVPAPKQDTPLVFFPAGCHDPEKCGILEMVDLEREHYLSFVHEKKDVDEKQIWLDVPYD
ncbi:unnamed protein product [Vitrella brassicaformis CCMP3155]|uniref:phosphoglycerate mutase (2,3-diphosphoglycerate-dependent) n=1 Tax=Vitrella brassicaformis (strain CCMP3155) TaxID=1169540 RepID=A0A0G4EJ71_VITBC|nr:unnamed protein product [Vitrella brassicaformis CCMP3155]|eukprot:CEL96753.1 unnamed protein product [Vitrella brassicaformis CCMP3155]